MNFIYEAPYPIKTKLLICFAIVLIMSFAVSVISVTQRVETVNAAVDLNRKLTGNFTVLVNTMEKTEVFNAQLFTYLDSEYTNTELRKTLESSLNEIAEGVDKLNVNDPDTGVYMHTVKGNGIKYIEFIKQSVFPLFDAGKHADALHNYIHDAMPLLEGMGVEYGKAVKSRFQQIDEASVILTNHNPTVFIIILTFFQLVFSFAISMDISTYIQRNVTIQLNALTSLAKGDFSINVKPQTEDEFGQLAESMQIMITKLRSSMIEVTTLASAINGSMNEIEQNSNTICDAAETAQTECVSVAAAAEQMAATNANIAENCTTAAKSSQESHKFTETGMENVNTTATSVTEQYELMEKNAEAIRELADEVEKISSIVGTIDEIASQTNLLALNAAIEAARAGEAGRGFAVVADEVRALATRTTASTQEIRGMVDRIQADSAAATTAMQSNLESMSFVTTESVELKSTLGQVMELVSGVNDQIGVIATSAEEQSTSSAQISTNMQRITECTKQVNELAQVSRSASVENASRCQTLINNLSFFKVEPDPVVAKADDQTPKHEYKEEQTLAI
ncbi:methyl-accepting chemotaxis protein [uncultured Anaerobiospirillum sp.]|uniref:methyl-accepting chemotaxis protein n=1 Tax=uncultured Anaerobiospirillum sp. TaxID=265728 RepID=UPI002804ED8A|nr:methyl-accepting chemotaxis protein [uncultured Anaerobiospirillum sp.]